MAKENETIADEMMFLLGEIKKTGEDNSKQISVVVEELKANTKETIINTQNTKAAFRRIDEINVNLSNLAKKVSRHENIINVTAGKAKGVAGAIRIIWIVGGGFVGVALTVIGMVFFR
jgi:uncharacterized membrane protein